MELADRIYEAVELLPKHELFILSAQMRDAALSVPSNIAEGKGRWSVREYRQFVRHSRGSIFELESHLEFARRRQLLSAELVSELLALAKRVVEKINRLIHYLNKRAKKPSDRRPATSEPLPRS